MKYSPIISSATGIIYAAMPEATGQRPSGNPASLYSSRGFWFLYWRLTGHPGSLYWSGPSSVAGPSQKEDIDKEENTATLSAPETVNSEVTSPESSTSHLT